MAETKAKGTKPKATPRAAKAASAPKAAPAARARPKPAERREPSDLAKIAVVGVPASGKTTFFRFLSGHFGLNLPILFVPERPGGEPLPLYGDLEQEVVLEEATYEATNPSDPEGGIETTTRYYVNRPMDDPTKLWVELAEDRTEQGVLTKYPLPTKYSQFVEMRMRFRYGLPSEGGLKSRPMVLHTIDEAGGIVSDYFTYDRLWLEAADAEVPERSCRVIPHFDSWRPDRRGLWRRGLTLLGRFLQDADAVLLLLAPSLPTLREQAQQVNLARGVFRYVRAREIPLVVAISKADRLPEFFGEIDHAIRDRTFHSAFDTDAFLRGRDGAGMGTILVAHDGQAISAREDVFLIASAVSGPDGRPMLVSESGEPVAPEGESVSGVPVMVNTTLPLARACERLMQRRSTGDG
jgi:hypothetical protein